MRALILLAAATLLVIANSVSLAHDFGPPRYRLTEIEDPTGALFLFPPSALNNRGATAGEAIGAAERIPYLWRNGRILAIRGDGFITPAAAASALNDRNQVVGFALIEETPRHLGGFVWTRGQLAYIGDLPGGQVRSFATDINNRGQVVGESNSADGLEAVLWQNGTLMSLGDLPGGAVESFATAINDRGVIVGQGTTDASAPAGAAFIWRDGVMSQLPLPGNVPGAFATDINNFNVVAGVAGLDGPDAPAAPVLWVQRRLKRLPLLPGTTIAGASAINDFGMVVGQSIMDPRLSGVATLWRRNEVYDLNDFVAEDDPLKSCVHLDSANDINERGQIVVVATDFCENDNVNAFRLDPVRGHKRH